MSTVNYQHIEEADRRRHDVVLEPRQHDQRDHQRQRQGCGNRRAAERDEPNTVENAPGEHEGGLLSPAFLEGEH